MSPIHRGLLTVGGALGPVQRRGDAKRVSASGSGLEWLAPTLLSSYIAAPPFALMAT